MTYILFPNWMQNFFLKLLCFSRTLMRSKVSLSKCETTWFLYAPKYTLWFARILTHQNGEIIQKFINFSSLKPFLKDMWVLMKCFFGNSDGKESACNAGDPASIPGSGKSPGEGSGNPLQYSCLSSVDIGGWHAAVRGVTKSRT